MYTRIPAGVPATDPFCGTFMAAFGPHGVELLQVGRTKAANGHEVVTARKLTGEPPAVLPLEVLFLYIFQSIAALNHTNAQPTVNDPEHVMLMGLPLRLWFGVSMKKCRAAPRFLPSRVDSWTAN